MPKGTHDLPPDDTPCKWALFFCKLYKMYLYTHPITPQTTSMPREYRKLLSLWIHVLKSKSCSRVYPFKTTQRCLASMHVMAGGTVVCGSALVYFNTTDGKKASTVALAPNPTTTTMSLEDIQTMVDAGRIVVTLRGVVYDVTNFTGHPGGYGRIQMAAGTDLEPYWRIYTQHNRGHIHEILNHFRIGMLSEEDAIKIRESTLFENPHENDPPMSEHLLTNTRHPYNAEARLSTLTDSFITPVGKHFVRNHNVVPDIDINDYELTIGGVGLNDVTLKFDDLKKFEQVKVTTVVQCNGNRREDFHFIDGKTPAFGPPHWVAGAISNSAWTGVRLRDLLRYAGMDVDKITLRERTAPEGATKVELKGMDTDETGNPYCCSIPFEKAIDPYGDVIIAYEMNGAPIPRSHGYPVRAIVPGENRSLAEIKSKRVKGSPDPDGFLRLRWGKKLQVPRECESDREAL